MAIEKKDKKAGISAAPVAIATPLLPSNAHSRVTPKGDGGARGEGLTKDIRNMNRSAVTDSRDKKPSAEAEDDELNRWIRWQLIRNDERLTAEAISDINQHLFTGDELNKKGKLTPDDLATADTRDLGVAGMPTLRVDENKTTRYYVGQELSTYLLSKPDHVGRITNIGEAQRSLYQSRFNENGIDVDLGSRGSPLLNPLLAIAMHKNSQIANYVQLTFAAAKRNGLDPIMLANQFYQESKFNPNARSHQGAMGISQMMPFHKGKYGLNTVEDFSDPEKSIEAGARMMSHLTQKYREQRLALVAYNGGGKAIDFVKERLGRQEISFEEWQSFMADRRSQLGNKKPSAWHVETLDYTRIIAGTASPVVVAENKKHRLPAPEPS